MTRTLPRGLVNWAASARTHPRAKDKAPRQAAKALTEAATRTRPHGRHRRVHHHRPRRAVHRVPHHGLPDASTARQFSALIASTLIDSDGQRTQMTTTWWQSARTHGVPPWRTNSRSTRRYAPSRTRRTGLFCPGARPSQREAHISCLPICLPIGSSSAGHADTRTNACHAPSPGADRPG